MGIQISEEFSYEIQLTFLTDCIYLPIIAFPIFTLLTHQCEGNKQQGSSC